MRIAIISDIHGNLVALEAVLADLEARQVGEVVCLGDVAAFGPQPREVIARLRELNGSVVMGNTDAWLLNPRPHPVRDEDSHKVTEIELWGAEQLSPADLDYVRTFQPMIEISLGDEAKLLCFHGSPRSDRDVIAPATPEEDLERMLRGFQATVMIGGHTHTQMFRRYGDAILMNPGSVGFPIERDLATGRVRNPPWAEYAVVTREGEALGVELRRVPVDVEAIRRAALDSGMPHVEWWMEGWDRG
ncbi:MAG: metallophosphoesterase family protein [Chloroflexi bacterium]|nr:metallophosphoesterase family protein [Chloroflexota bacterium]